MKDFAYFALFIWCLWNCDASDEIAGAIRDSRAECVCKCGGVP